MRDPDFSPQEAARAPLSSILAADDDPAFLRLLSEALHSGGCEVVVESSGYGALNRVRERPFDLVFLDIRMPISGVVAVKEILDLRPDTEIVIITGSPESAEVRQALSYGARLCLPKPLTARELLAVTADLLRERRVSKDPAG